MIDFSDLNQSQQLVDVFRFFSYYYHENDFRETGDFRLYRLLSKIDDSVPVPTPDRKYCETTAKSDEPFSGQDGQFRSAQIQDLLKNLPVKGPKSKVPKD